jgi:hypothetical protein
LIVINEKINDKNIKIRFNKEKLILSELNKFFKPKIDTAPSVGMDNKNDILAASNLLKFRSLAAVIVIPDLLTPGTKDNT